MIQYSTEMLKGKAAFSGALTVLLEAAKQDSTVEQVKSVFEDLGVNTSRATPPRKGSSSSIYALG